MLRTGLLDLDEWTIVNVRVRFVAPQQYSGVHSAVGYPTRFWVHSWTLGESTHRLWSHDMSQRPAADCPCCARSRKQHMRRFRPNWHNVQNPISQSTLSCYIKETFPQRRNAVQDLVTHFVCNVFPWKLCLPKPFARIRTTINHVKTYNALLIVSKMYSFSPSVPQTSSDTLDCEKQLMEDETSSVIPCWKRYCSQFFSNEVLQNFSLNFLELPKEQKDAFLAGFLMAVKKHGKKLLKKVLKSARYFFYLKFEV